MNSISVQEFEYAETLGVCQGGYSPQNNAGKQNYAWDRKCKARCDSSSTCTGYILGIFFTNAADWCNTYTSVGATGNAGNWASSFVCNVKETGIYLRGT